MGKSGRQEKAVARVLEGESPEALVSRLHSGDASVREHARRALTREGESVVPLLQNLLTTSEEHVRWEAAKILGSIGGKKAAEALVLALGDESRDVRWVAAEGLTSIGPRAIEPLLHELIVQSDSAWVREGATRVIDASMEKGEQEHLRPVLRALTNGAPIFEVPLAAYEALHKMYERKSQK